MSTINKKEIEKFSKIADEWWDAKGKFKPLHRFNPIRIKYIIDKCTAHFNLSNNNNEILTGLKFFDIFLDFFINSLVSPLIAEETTITLYFFFT